MGGGLSASLSAGSHQWPDEALSWKQDHRLPPIVAALRHVDYKHSDSQRAVKTNHHAESATQHTHTYTHTTKRPLQHDSRGKQTQWKEGHLQKKRENNARDENRGNYQDIFFFSKKARNKSHLTVLSVCLSPRKTHARDTHPSRSPWRLYQQKELKVFVVFSFC